jgi:hypothetical protein
MHVSQIKMMVDVTPKRRIICSSDGEHSQHNTDK